MFYKRDVETHENEGQKPQHQSVAEAEEREEPGQPFPDAVLERLVQVLDAVVDVLASVYIWKRSDDLGRLVHVHDPDVPARRGVRSMRYQAEAAPDCARYTCVGIQNNTIFLFKFNNYLLTQVQSRL